MYLTYEEYQAYGGTLPEADFTLAEFRARKRIDYLTASRVSAFWSWLEELTGYDKGSRLGKAIQYALCHFRCKLYCRQP